MSQRTIEELCEELLLKREKAQHGVRREWRRLAFEVEEILLQHITRMTEKSWNAYKTDEVMELLLSRKSNPYAVAEDVLRKIIPGTRVV